MKPLTPLQLELISEFGSLQEKLGKSPTAAKITALLITADELEFSFEDIMNTLQLSKASISNALNYLVASEEILVYNKLGCRKKFYKTNMANWQKMFKNRFNSIFLIKTVFIKILAQRPEETSQLNKDFKEVIDFLDFLEKETSNLIEKWNEEKKRTNS